MNLSPEVTMGIAGGVIAASCLAAVVALALREKRKTGSYPSEVVSTKPTDPGW